MKRRKVLIIITIILLVIGISFASWIITLNQTDNNLISSKCFNVTLSEENPINLTNAYPITDTEGGALTPFTFTITNTCNSNASYQVNLEILNTTTLASSEVKVMLDDGAPALLSSKTVTTKTLDSATTAYILKTGYLDPNESVTYNLRLWIDESSTVEMSANKTFSSKVTVTAGYKDSVTNMDRCEAEYGEGAAVCNIIANADTTNSKCAQFNEDGSIKDPHSSTEEPIICTMEDDYGTSYYLRGNHQDNNVKFANMCWKLVRVTGTGGLKLIYNGDLDENGKCTTTSGEHLGFTGQTLSLSGNKVYGTSYTYDGTNYTLTDTSNIDFSIDSTSTIGKYTCGDTNTSCTNPYYVVSKENDTTGYVLKTGVSTNYAQIGSSAFNSISGSPSYVGYMYNDVYPYISKNLSSNTNNYYYGGSFTYTGGTYTLNNTVQFADISDSTNQTSLNTHHYTCFKASDNMCSEMYYIYYLYNETTLYYIKLNGNETGPEALNKMVNNNDINVKDSTIKKFIDGWYAMNLKGTEYESKLEDTVFCNDRTIDNLGGWSETGSLSNYLYFNGGQNKYYLKCPNKRDAFTVSDTEKGNSALTYPIGLLTTAEHSLIGNYNVNKTNVWYWSSAPFFFYSFHAYERYVIAPGYWYYYYYVNNGGGVRPAVSLRPGITFKSGGDGSAGNPYEVDMDS